ncbi:Ankyrin repeat-containing domain containing protein [Trema orientale]|uniref:Ankyrin repeat-containing domain containing protein n=1 Tax=Trema orientale TaxID=63057 RepID=A0A2P5G236_TREOI|nr:Ankyrin repeat-containing domain containing protein [Trema orientale]
MDLRDRQGNTAFGKDAAAAGPSEIIQMLMPMNNGQFPSTKGGGRVTPLYSAVLFGHSAVALALYNGNRQNLSDDEKKWLFFTSINNQIFDLALKLIHDYGILQLHCARDGTTSETALHVLARKPSAFASQGIWKRLINSSKQLKSLNGRKIIPIDI